MVFLSHSLVVLLSGFASSYATESALSVPAHSFPCTLKLNQTINLSPMVVEVLGAKPIEAKF